jgi:hypothetical protein
MNPDDESVRRAMQSIEPAGTDVPDLFDRVAAGARRRRRQRSIGAVSAAAVVVAAVALVPALGRGKSSTNTTQPARPGPAAVSSPGASSLPVHGEPPVLGPPMVSPSAPASSALAVNSPTPPLTSTPPTPPLITTGACAGLSLGMSVADAVPGIITGGLPVIDLEAEPSLNLLTVHAGATISFEASGPVACVNRLAVMSVAGNFPTSTRAAQPDYTFTPLEIRPDAPGTEGVDVMLRPCATAAKCDGGQLLASTIIAVDPPASSSANPVSSNLGACPTVLPLVPGADAAAQAKAAAIKVVPTIYPPEPTNDFTVTAVYQASQSLNGGKGIGTIAYGTCGKTIGDRTWVVEVHFPHDPNNSASTGNGQLFVSDFANGGWQVWLRNH